MALILDYQLYGILILCLANIIDTVYPSIFYKLLSCYHYYGGYIDLLDNIIATVSPLLFYISGLC